MAKCVYCKKGWWLFTRFDDLGLCKKCRQPVRDDIQTRSEAVHAAIKIAEATGDLESRLAAWEQAQENSERLGPYEAVGLPTMEPAPSELLAKLPATKDAIYLDELIRLTAIAQQASADAEGAEKKVAPYDDILARAEGFRGELSATEALDMAMKELSVSRGLAAIAGLTWELAEAAHESHKVDDPEQKASFFERLLSECDNYAVKLTEEQSLAQLRAEIETARDDAMVAGLRHGFVGAVAASAEAFGAAPRLAPFARAKRAIDDYAERLAKNAAFVGLRKELDWARDTAVFDGLTEQTRQAEEVSAAASSADKKAAPFIAVIEEAESLSAEMADASILAGLLVELHDKKDGALIAGLRGALAAATEASAEKNEPEGKGACFEELLDSLEDYRDRFSAPPKLDNLHREIEKAQDLAVVEGLRSKARDAAAASDEATGCEARTAPLEEALAAVQKYRGQLNHAEALEQLVTMMQRSKDEVIIEELEEAAETATEKAESLPELEDKIRVIDKTVVSFEKYLPRLSDPGSLDGLRQKLKKQRGDTIQTVLQELATQALAESAAADSYSAKSFPLKEGIRLMEKYADQASDPVALIELETDLKSALANAETSRYSGF